MSNEKEVMLNAFSKYFNKTDEELTEMLYDKGEDDTFTLKDGVAELLIDLDARRIERVRKEATESGTKKFDDFAKKTKRDILTNFEKEIKSQYGLESDKTGLELVNELAEKFGSTGDLTEESIKTNPLYLKLEKEWHTNASERELTLKKDFDDFKNSVERNGKISEIKKVAKQEFLRLNPALSDNPVVAENQTQEFLRRFEAHDYIIEGDTIMIKSGDGRLEDAHGNAVGFDTFVKGEAEKLYDFKVQDPKGSPGNITTGGSAKKIVMTKIEYGEAIALAEKNRDKEAFDRLANVTVVG